MDGTDVAFLFLDDSRAVRYGRIHLIPELRSWLERGGSSSVLYGLPYAGNT